MAVGKWIPASEAQPIPYWDLTQVGSSRWDDRERPNGPVSSNHHRPTLSALRGRLGEPTPPYSLKIASGSVLMGHDLSETRQQSNGGLKDRLAQAAADENDTRLSTNDTYYGHHLQGL